MTSPRSTVLLIEDDAADATLIAGWLTGGDAPYDLDHADSLAAGLRRLAAGGVAAVLLDLGLPDGQGLDTFRQVRRQAPAVPVLILCPLSDEPVAAQAVQDGAWDYFVKGYVQRGFLLRALRHALDRSRAEEGLREGERRYKQLLESITDYIYTVTVADGRPVATRHGPGCLAVTGYTTAEFTADQYLWFHIIHPDDRAAVLRQAAALLAGDAAPPLEHRIYHKDGSVRWIRNTTVLHRDDRGRVTGYDGLIVDITVRKRAEEAIRASEALYVSLVESIPLSVFRKDLAGRFTFANRRFCDALARPLADILGKTDHDFYAADLADKYRADDLRVIAGGQVYEDTESHPKAAGGRTYVTVLKTPVYGPDGAIVGVQGIFWDVTEQKLAEELRGQMRGARAIQQKLFPPHPPRVPGFDLAGASYPAEATGGDYYDFIALHNATVGFVLGDVSGHGFGPALLAAVTHACLRTLALTRLAIEPSAMLATGNSLIHEDTGGEPFVTLIFALLDPLTRTLTYCSAGHPPGFLLDAAGRLKARLDNTGPALGVFPGADFPPADPIRLAPGDLVLLLSDGVQDAMAPDGTSFGLPRALEVVRTHRHLPAQGIVDALCQAARDFCRATPQHDDITVVVIKADANSVA